MNTEPLLRQFAFQRFYLGLLVDDIADNQLTAQPAGIICHPAWHLGHLADVADFWTQVLGGTKTLGDEWAKRFAQNTVPVENRSFYPSKAELIATLDDRRSALVERCSKVSDAQWNGSHPVTPVLAFLPTLWEATHMFMLSHESNHLGQIATWRRAQGLPMALSKLRTEAASAA